MQIRPLNNQAMHSSRQTSRVNSQSFNFIQRFVFAVLRVKMRRRVVVVIHINQYAKKLADARHFPSKKSNLRHLLQPANPERQFPAKRSKSSHQRRAATKFP